MRLIIRGSGLPGGRFAQYENVHVGLQVHRDPAGLVSGDAGEATWETEVTIVDRPGESDFRGAAVHGRRGERFLYLTWVTVDGDACTMFRRAKMMLDDLPPALRSETAVVVEVPLAEEDGSPRCARIPAGLMTWRRGP